MGRNRAWTEYEKAVIHNAVLKGLTASQLRDQLPGRPDYQIDNSLKLMRCELEGICRLCKRTPLPEGYKFKTCEGCRAKNRRKYNKAKAEGLCVKCRKRPANSSLTRCTSCHTKWEKCGKRKQGSKNSVRLNHDGFTRWAGPPGSQWLLPCFPQDAERFVDVFGGSGDWVLNAQHSERVYNEIDPRLIELARTIKTQPEHFLEYMTEVLDCPKDQLHRLRELREGYPSKALRAAITYATCLYSKEAGNLDTGFVSGALTPYPWTLKKWVREWHQALQDITIEHQDALDILDVYDSPETLFFIDPPWLGYAPYKHNYTEPEHRRLGERLGSLEGTYIWLGASKRETLQIAVDSGVAHTYFYRVFRGARCILMSNKPVKATLDGRIEVIQIDPKSYGISRRAP